MANKKINPFEELYLRLEPAAAALQAKLIGVTSSAVGAGSTTIALGLARCARAINAREILVIDAARATNPKRRIASRLGLSSATANLANGNGESNARAQALAPILTSEDGIGVLSLEPDFIVSPDARAWSNTLGELRHAYATIFIDLGTLQTPTPARWQPLLDKHLLVVDAERATVENLRRLKKDLSATGLKVDGFALNRRRHYIPQFIYDML